MCLHAMIIKIKYLAFLGITRFPSQPRLLSPAIPEIVPYSIMYLGVEIKVGLVSRIQSKKFLHYQGLPGDFAQNQQVTEINQSSKVLMPRWWCL